MTIFRTGDLVRIKTERMSSGRAREDSRRFSIIACLPDDKFHVVDVSTGARAVVERGSLVMVRHCYNR